MKFKVRLVRESFIEVEADNLEQVEYKVYNKGLSKEEIENGADFWDIISIDAYKNE